MWIQDFVTPHQQNANQIIFVPWDTIFSMHPKFRD
jgi:hypothetical protein